MNSGLDQNTNNEIQLNNLFAVVSDQTERQRYSGVNQIIHWAIALSMFSAIVLGWVMVAGGDDPNILPLWEWHKTLGVIILFVTIARLVWRVRDPAPTPQASQPIWAHLLAKATHWVFFAAMIAMPVSGYLLSAASGHAPKLFSLISTPALLPKSEQIASIGAMIHLGGQWLIYSLIVLHISGVVYHVAVRRDRTLERMLPKPRLEN